VIEDVEGDDMGGRGEGGHLVGKDAEVFREIVPPFTEMARDADEGVVSSLAIGVGGFGAAASSSGGRVDPVHEVVEDDGKLAHLRETGDYIPWSRRIVRRFDVLLGGDFPKVRRPRVRIGEVVHCEWIRRSSEGMLDWPNVLKLSGTPSVSGRKFGILPR